MELAFYLTICHKPSIWDLPSICTATGTQERFDKGGATTLYVLNERNVEISTNTKTRQVQRALDTQEGIKEVQHHQTKIKIEQTWG